MSIPMWQIAVGAVALIILLWGVVVLAPKPRGGTAEVDERDDTKVAQQVAEQSSTSAERTTNALDGSIALGPSSLWGVAKLVRLTTRRASPKWKWCCPALGIVRRLSTQVNPTHARSW